MAGNDHDISTLNSLIATTLDSVEGYEESAKASEGARFANLFTARAAERRQVASELQAEVRRLGAEPSDGGTALGGAHRMFVNLKAAITGRDDQAVVNEVERGEDYIKEKFETAMKDDELSAATRGLLEKAFASIRKGHDRASQMKHGMAHAD